MFKLVKILNSGSNVPEPISIDFDASNSSKAGCIYYMAHGTMTTLPDNEYDAMVYALQNLEFEGPDVSALCYIITPDMIFETTVKNAPTHIATGEPFKIVNGNEGSGEYISTDVTSDADIKGVVVNTNSYKSTGKVLVRFLC